MTYAALINSFNRKLNIDAKLPKGVEVLNPFQNKVTQALSEEFYIRYYNDSTPRQLIMGINPGRLGSGLTGVPFTDPINLKKFCGIENTLQQKHELSSEFVYKVIEPFGGPELFYNRFYFSSISPLGFTQDGKNLNYYDIKELQSALMPFILSSLNEQLRWGLHREKCFCFGEGKNFEFLKRLNDEHGFFKQIVPLPHPRFIMQYKRKQVAAFVDLYLEKLKG
jgi:hypothetical protein